MRSSLPVTFIGMAMLLVACGGSTEDTATTSGDTDASTTGAGGTLGGGGSTNGGGNANTGGSTNGAGNANTGGSTNGAGNANTGGSTNTGGGPRDAGAGCPATIESGVTACTNGGQRCTSGGETCVCFRQGGRDAGARVFTCTATPEGGLPGFDGGIPGYDGGSVGNCPSTEPTAGDSCPSTAYCTYAGGACACFGANGARTWRCF